MAIKNDISLTWLLSFGFAVLTVGGGFAATFVLQGRDGTQNSKDITSLGATMTTQIGSLKTDLKDGLSDVRAQIAGLPDQRAQLGQIDRRLGNIERVNETQDGRLMILERAQGGLESRLTAAERASPPPVPVKSR